MYSNGGYLMLDFKNTAITQTPKKINGITYNNIKMANKPIVIINLYSVSNETYSFAINMPTYVLARESTSSGGILLNVLVWNVPMVILVSPNDDISIANIPSVSTLNNENIESEVSTNASKSDSNTDK